MSGVPDFKNVAFKDTSFANLMNKRIYNVLLIATKYDSFMTIAINVNNNTELAMGLIVCILSMIIY